MKKIFPAQNVFQKKIKFENFLKFFFEIFQKNVQNFFRQMSTYGTENESPWRAGHFDVSHTPPHYQIWGNLPP